MPNYVYNTITIHGGNLEKLKEIVKSEGIARHYKPMPEELNITSGSRGDMGYELLFGNKKGILSTEELQRRFTELDEEGRREVVDLGLKYQSNVEKYGSKTWYDWCNSNWGTKWGCASFEVNENVITYTTAWSPLDEELIEMLAKDFPNFTYEWQEEQGFGAVLEIEEGEINVVEEYDSPNLEYIEDESLGDFTELYLLKSEHRDKKLGYYLDWDLTEFLGETKEEALNNLK